MSGQVSNEQLYQELRKTQRRFMAVGAIVVAGVGLAIWFIDWQASVGPLAAAFVLLFMADYLQSGRFSRIVKRVARDAPMSEPELAEELGEAYEPVEHIEFSGGIRDLVFEERGEQ